MNQTSGSGDWKVFLNSYFKQAVYFHGVTTWNFSGSQIPVSKLE